MSYKRRASGCYALISGESAPHSTGTRSSLSTCVPTELFFKRLAQKCRDEDEFPSYLGNYICTQGWQICKLSPTTASILCEHSSPRNTNSPQIQQWKQKKKKRLTRSQWSECEVDFFFVYFISKKRVEKSKRSKRSTCTYFN